MKFKFTFYYLFLTLLNFFHAHANIDLEANPQHFILETKQIVLKEYPEAFNPSIISWNGKILMSFRVIPDPLFTFNSNIGLVFLDEDFNPISTPQILNTQEINSLVPSRAEDARLVSVGNKLYIIYSDNKDQFISRGGFRVYVSDLIYNGSQFVVNHTDCLKDFEGASPYLREKNWVPFDYHGTLMLAYSLTPHKIFRPLLGSEKCETYAVTDQQISWNYGELRGGTPAIYDQGQYLAFFHSSIDMLSDCSNNRSIAHYFMGAYTFSSTPPFEITNISKEPIIGKGFYKGKQYKPYWKSVRCIFPCGILIQDPYIYVSYGRHDHEIWIVKLDKEELLKSLSSK